MIDKLYYVQVNCNYLKLRIRYQIPVMNSKMFRKTEIRTKAIKLLSIPISNEFIEKRTVQDKDKVLLFQEI